MTGKKGSYRFLKNLRTHHQIIFAVLVAIGVVSLWRGLWGLFDVLILPNNYLYSSVFSLILGVVILGGMHVLVREFVEE